MHLFQAGVGSGGMVVLDLLARDRSLSRATIIDPDIYSKRNIHRHMFPPSGIGRLKVELAAEWLRERRPDISVTTIDDDLTDPGLQSEYCQIAASCDLGVCAVDNEPAKYAFDALMRTNGKPWTLGEVLSGGIGGWIHRFVPSGPCYGCIASHLQRTVVEEPPAPPPDYANPGGAIAETTIPASKASIEAIAAIHALVTLELLPLSLGERGFGSEDKSLTDLQGGEATREPDAGSANREEPFTSLLFTLRRVPGVFEDAFRTYRFRIPRSPGCLVCALKENQNPHPGDNLDVAIDQALERLAPQ